MGQHRWGKPLKMVGWFGSAIALGALWGGVAIGQQTPAQSTGRIDAQTQAAMIAAIEDEYHAHAFYTAVIEKYGAVRPFTNIVQAEERHAARLQTLFEQYGLPVPPDTFAGTVAAPQSIAAACAMGIEAEILNVQMYDEFLTWVSEPALRDLFSQFRRVSSEKHQRAFERCQQRLQ
ncbi:ferritin-like domain-containing protein [Spirulina major]|uniref:ferritin-like domain-containing protein n=1 Tax=Spirulina major TaxID=270636 RepID=UPI0009334320|nr:DUF2202 domain-containing protein [Spirulina major]